MHNGVEHAKYENKPSSHLVEINMLIYWKKVWCSSGTKECKALSQHYDHNEGAVKIETLSYKVKKKKNTDI
jgi:hypothetical protein